MDGQRRRWQALCRHQPGFQGSQTGTHRQVQHHRLHSRNETVRQSRAWPRHRFRSVKNKIAGYPPPNARCPRCLSGNPRNFRDGSPPLAQALGRKTNILEEQGQIFAEGENHRRDGANKSLPISAFCREPAVGGWRFRPRIGRPVQRGEKIDDAFRRCENTLI